VRAALFDAIAQVAELWSADAEVGQVGLPSVVMIVANADTDAQQALQMPTDVSLPAGPLLDVVCRAAGRRLNGVWLALAAILIAQLNPPPLILILKSGPSEEAERVCGRPSAGLSPPRWDSSVRRGAWSRCAFLTSTTLCGV
jgi:hypothetical protein